MTASPTSPRNPGDVLSDNDDAVGFDLSDAASLHAALDRARSQLQQSRYEWIKTNIHLVNLNEVSKLIVTGGDVSETIARISDFLARSVDVRRLVVALRDGERGALVGRIVDTKSGSHLDISIPLDSDDSVAVQSLVEGEPIQVGPGDAGDFFGTTATIDGRRPDDFSTFVAHPIPSRRGEERALGVVAIDLPDDEFASDTELLSLKTFLNQIGTLIENAELYRDLRREERFRANVMDSMSSGLITMDRNHRITSMNVRAGDMLGVDRDTVVGAPIDGVWRPTGDEGNNPLVQALDTGKPVLTKDVKLVRPDERRVVLNVSTSPLWDADGRNIGVVAELTDMSRVRAMEDEIFQLEKLAAVGRLTTSVAHEIRNPLAGIGTGVQYLARTIGEDDSKRETIHFILNEIMRLDRIIVDLYTISRPSPMVLERTSAVKVAELALRSLQDLSGGGEIVVVLDADDDLPEVSMDADKIQQVLINLIKNAYETSETGSEVRIEVHSVSHYTGPADEGRPTHVAIAVTDHGAGISEEDRGKIFEPFFSRKDAGTGLGLYVSHSIIERHGGEIQVRTEVGEGTTVTVELPIEGTRAGDS